MYWHAHVADITRRAMRVLSLLVLLGFGIPVELADFGSVTARWAGLRNVLGRGRRLPRLRVRVSQGSRTI